MAVRDAHPSAPVSGLIDGRLARAVAVLPLAFVPLVMLGVRALARARGSVVDAEREPAVTRVGRP